METTKSKSRSECYPDYKNSEVQWIGDIPLNWEVRRIKFLFSIGRGRVISQQELVVDGKYPVYSSQTQDDGILGYINTYDFDCKQITWTTDGANAGTVFLREGKHNCTNVCGTLQPKSTPLCMEYLFFALKVATLFYKRPDTNGAKIMNGEMAEVFVTFPPLPEQTRIANFLDRKTAQIDQAIAQKERLIELLKERRQILIHNAVTRGLNPDVKMKDSGVEWIGEVPEHWEIQPIKYSLHGIIDCEHKTAPFVDEKEYFVVRTSNVKEGKLVYEDAKHTHSKGYKEWTRRGIPKAGDIFLTREAPAGEACLIPEDVNVCLGQRMVWLRVDNKKLNAEFAIFLIYSKLVRTYIDYLSAGSTVLHFNISDINNIPIMCMPLKEQDEIVAFLNITSNKIATAIASKQDEIEKLKEYKATLINSAVTGRLRIT